MHMILPKDPQFGHKGIYLPEYRAHRPVNFLSGMNPGIMNILPFRCIEEMIIMILEAGMGIDGLAWGICCSAFSKASRMS